MLEEHFAVDQRRYALGECIERVGIEHRQVRQLTFFDRADVALDAELDRGVERYQPQRVVRAQPAEAQRLGRLQGEMPYHFGGIRVDRCDHAALGHARGVKGGRIVGFDLVSPPIRERRSSTAVAVHLRDHAITLEHVLQYADAVAIVLRHGQQAQNLVCPIAVAVDPNLAVMDGGQCFQPKIAPYRARILAFGFIALEVCPFLLIVAGGVERTTEDRLHAHA